jgi:fructokinase
MQRTDSSGEYVGVELGGTKMVIATGLGGALLAAREEVPTADPDSTLKAVRSAIRDVTSGRPPKALGLASFGPIDLRIHSDRFGELLNTPKPGWSGVNVLRALSEDLSVPTVIDTDVNAAVVAEKAWGVGRAHDHVAYLTVGTGVGGGIWSNGRLVRGSNHPEIGHIRVSRRSGDDYISSCPFHEDCLEGMASGTALRQRWGRGAEDLGHLTGMATSLEAWYLARGIAGMCSVVPVDMVIIGGGLSKLPGLHSEVAAALPEASGLYPSVPFAEGGPIIAQPELGDDSGVLGAIELARIVKEGSAEMPG